MKELSEDKLHVLAKIAAIDGSVADEERKMLVGLAEKYGYSKQAMDSIIDNPTAVGDFKDLSATDRLEFMFIALKLIQADELIYNTEIDFCKKLATQMGIDASVVDVYGTRDDITLEKFLDEAARYA